MWRQAMYTWYENSCYGYYRYACFRLEKNEILQELPDLQKEDIEAVLRYVSHKLTIADF